jgi:DNA-binding MarR family transcriptional regulator
MVLLLPQLNALCRLVIDFEAQLVTGLALGSDTITLDTPGLGALVSIDVFGALRPGAVAVVLGMSSGGTTKVLQRLEAAGLVLRRLDSVPGDRRGVVIELTDAGRTAIRGTEAILIEQASRWAEALTPFASPTPTDASAPAVPADLDASPGVAGPAVAALFHLVGAIDQVVIENVDDIAALHPADPRGLLLLTELDLSGPLPVGAVATLIGRSRASTNALLSALDASGMVERSPHAEGSDRRLVLARITSKGRRLLVGLTTAFTSKGPELRPLVDSYLAVLAPAAR